MKYCYLFALLFIIVSCKHSQKVHLSEYPKARLVEDSVKYIMFCEAYKVESTAPFFVVFTVKNKNTGEIKKMCCQSPLLEGAQRMEMGKSYNEYLDMSQFKDRYFEFSNTDALNNISFDDYDSQTFDSLRMSLNVDSIVYVINNKTAEMFNFDRRDIQLMTSQILFEYGIVLSTSCLAGNMSGFAVYDPNNENWMWDE